MTPHSSEQAHVSRPARLGGLGFYVAAGLGGLCVFAGLAAYMHVQQRNLTSDTRAAALLNSAAPPRPVAQVASALAAMKLVTVEIDTKVRVQRGETSWRGDVSAAVELPVRLSYGVDLSTLTSLHLGFSVLEGRAGAYIVSIPPPERIATQIMTERVPPELNVGWLRLKSMSGEYYISQARKDAPRAAMDLELLPEDARRVEELTIAQVRALVRSLTHPDADVIIRVRRIIDDEKGNT